MKINSFSGENRFLSNFWPAKVILNGVEFVSVEHAYVASKTLDENLRKQISGMTPGQAKRFGRTFDLREDWNEVKLSVMENLLRQKFSHKELSDMLIATGQCELIEGNTWGDTFWGVCNGVGQNHLGKLLMKIRHEKQFGIDRFIV